VRNKSHWTPKVTLEGPPHLTEERNGSKGPNFNVVDDVDDYVVYNLIFIITGIFLKNAL
jgi:hypothetical protein